MKKVLFMLSSMNIGGVEKSLLSLLSVMPKDQYDITVLLLEKKGGFLKEIPDWVKVEEATWFKEIKPVIMQPPQQTVKDYYSNKHFIGIPSFVCSYLVSKYLDNRYLYYKEVLKSVPIKETTYDVAISYQGPTDIIDYYVANKVTAQKKISWVHFDISKHLINERLYKKLYIQYDKIFAVSNEASKKLIEKIPNIESKTEVFMNVISKELIRDMAQRSVEFDDDFKGIKIVTVGRLSKEKGQDIAIKVLAKLRKKGYNVRWYCVGEGNARKGYEKLIEEYGVSNDFILLGAKVNPYPFIEKSDIYVQTSRHEGYCLTLAEAKSLNKPIVTTNFIGAFEQINDQCNGYIVKSNEEEIYEKVKYLVENRQERSRLITNLKKDKANFKKEIKKLDSFINRKEFVG
ncbi:glycosyltransferase [Alkalihalobacillus sp. MEB130]|uniref:glycosyltransferase n=1 Tax=Alkalihalobacillus sp. MEB130 TaxID=2976704 RepID=UPI0028E035E7|nr:glycosyltransferase [Alkalihalobacillus sp. MEB130]MDT8861093.1 glycosyltransferase [Alkalihalobacillus sp. MEB130]